MVFKNRIDAGKKLSNLMGFLSNRKDLILALPRGGVPLGIVIAQKYSLSFGLLLAKKITLPSDPEYAIGAIAEDGEPVFEKGLMKKPYASLVKKEISNLKKEEKKKRIIYGKFLKKYSLKNRNVTIVDDGIATGLTMLAAVKAAKNQQAIHVKAAVPIIPYDTFQQLNKEVDQIYALKVVKNFFGGIGNYYERFPQINDQQVQEMLKDFS